MNTIINKAITGIAAILVFIAGCDKWDDSADISHITYLPQFELTGGDFVSVVQKSGGYKDRPVLATVNNTPVNWYYLNSFVDTETPGLYIITYYAENEEGFSSTAERIVAVTYDEIDTETDLSGTWATNVFGAEVESRITRLNSQGLYKCSEVMGYPGAAMPGRIADLGDNRLALLPGEGYFGTYEASEGSYSRRTLSWTVFLSSPEYSGIQIPVTWRKKE